MVDILSMVDLTSISAMLAATGVLVGVVFAILELRNLVKTRQIDLIMRLHQSFAWQQESVEAWQRVMSLGLKDYNEYTNEYGSIFSKNPTNTAVLINAMFFEGIGVLVHRKLVNIDIIAELLPISMVWEKMKPIAEGLRKQLKNPRTMEWFEYLYNELQKREQQLAKT